MTEQDQAESRFAEAVRAMRPGRTVAADGEPGRTREPIAGSIMGRRWASWRSLATLKNEFESQTWLILSLRRSAI